MSDLVRQAKDTMQALSEVQSMLESTLATLAKARARVREVIGTDAPRGVDLSRLSARERQVFDLIGSGLGTTEIASKLGTSPKTVDAQKRVICQKLKVAGNKALAALAEGRR